MSWTLCKDEMPPEHDSMFKGYKNTELWYDSMWETESDKVLISCRCKDNGENVTMVGRTHDGVWKLDTTYLSLSDMIEIVAWQPMPDPLQISESAKFDNKAYILEFLENCYTGARMMDDLEMEVRIARALFAYKYDVEDNPFVPNVENKAIEKYCKADCECVRKLLAGEDNV